MGDYLGLGLGHGRRQAEGLDGPVQVALPPLLLEGQALAQSGLVHLRHASCSQATRTEEASVLRLRPPGLTWMTLQPAASSAATSLRRASASW